MAAVSKLHNQQLLLRQPGQEGKRKKKGKKVCVFSFAHCCACVFVCAEG